MNKRARLTRRILRDHRRGAWHASRARRHPSGAEIWRYWDCTHCRNGQTIDPPDAYR